MRSSTTVLDDGDGAVGRAVVADQDLLVEAGRLGVDRAHLPQDLADRALLLVRGDQDGQEALLHAPLPYRVQSSSSTR
jgi:hypothetical protein